MKTNPLCQSLYIIVSVVFSVKKYNDFENSSTYKKNEVTQVYMTNKSTEEPNSL